MASSSSSSHLSAYDSDSSTAEWDHEPFDSFRNRVVALALKTIWPESVAQEVTVERLKGGSYNRIIGVARQPLNDQTDSKTQYVLRIPRRSATQVDRDVAALQFVHQNTDIPVPEVVMFDESECNAIGSPYTIQVRIQGVDMYSTFPKLSHEHRCQFAREFGRIFMQMVNVQSNRAGKLVMPADNKSMTARICVAPWRPLVGKSCTPHNDPAHPEPVYNLLRDAFEAWKAEGLEQCPDSTLRPEFMDRFVRMASELQADGWLLNQRFSIAHLDLAPRNILIDPIDDKDMPIISAVLDWDSAVLAPPFMSCAPPMWIWDWQDDDDEDERLANNTPSTPEAQELKRIFEEAAGQEYCRLAYEPAYRLARRLVRFAIDGINYGEDCREAEAMLGEWADISRNDKEQC